jgi:hypothetical protein
MVLCVRGTDQKPILRSNFHPRLPSPPGLVLYSVVLPLPSPLFSNGWEWDYEHEQKIFLSRTESEFEGRKSDSLHSFLLPNHVTLLSWRNTDNLLPHLSLYFETGTVRSPASHLNHGAYMGIQGDGDRDK